MEDKADAGMNLQTKVVLGLAGLLAVVSLARGACLDAQPAITQPELFWPFLFLGLGGSLLGWRLGMRHDNHLGRNVLALFGALLSWRLSYFPLMVVSGWKASLGEFALHSIGLGSVIYPTFLLLMFAQNLAIGTVAAAAVAVPQGAAPSEGRLLNLRRLVYAPPRKLLWALACLALPVAFLTSFSWPSDYVLFGDAPWSEPRTVPPISEPRANPYATILDERGDELGLGSKVLALNAALTYPLVPETPWGKAMKGTLEAETRAHPLASSRDRVDEHYLAYIAAHSAIRGEDE
ncbi:MAG: hypothetical protein H6839_08710 [Planctomycetes bacterium]|nr:hypothetical protein [Planctomycetota bacterium]